MILSCQLCSCSTFYFVTQNLIYTAFHAHVALGYDDNHISKLSITFFFFFLLNFIYYKNSNHTSPFLFNPPKNPTQLNITKANNGPLNNSPTRKWKRIDYAATCSNHCERETRGWNHPFMFPTCKSTTPTQETTGSPGPNLTITATTTPRHPPSLPEH